jgi:hypothetical protein
MFGPERLDDMGEEMRMLPKWDRDLDKREKTRKIAYGL